MPYRNLVIICLAAIISFACFHTAQRNRYASTIGQAMSIIEDRALEPSERKELFYSAMDGMMRSLDEHSAFIDPQRLPVLEEHLDQEFGGVGFVVETDPETGEMMVLSPIYNSPAYEAGIEAGDVILAINGEPTAEIDVNEAVNRIRGPTGSSVQLTLRSIDSQESRDVDLERRLIEIESVLGDRRKKDGTWIYSLEDHPEIAYIRLIEFGEKSVNELRRVLSGLPNDTQGLIFDLRDNSGGLLDAAVDICDMFIESGTIVTIKNRGGKLDRPPYVASAGTEISPGIPLVVLVNENTASASEIVAACLQDSKRATIAGTQSFGKGTVQQIIKIDGGRSALKLTVSSYWRPSGKNIHRLKDAERGEWGVSPDPGCEVLMDEDQQQAWFLWRRQRDFPATKIDAAALKKLLQSDEDSSSTSEEASDAADEPPTLDPDDAPSTLPVDPDPQLRKAIEIILAALNNNIAAR